MLKKIICKVLQNYFIFLQYTCTHLWYGSVNIIRPASWYESQGEVTNVAMRIASNLARVMREARMAREQFFELGALRRTSSCRRRCRRRRRRCRRRRRRRRRPARDLHNSFN